MGSPISDIVVLDDDVELLVVLVVVLVELVVEFVDLGAGRMLAGVVVTVPQSGREPSADGAADVVDAE